MNLLEFVVGLDRIDLLEHQNIAQKIKCRERKEAETLMKKHIRRILKEWKQYAIKNGWIFEREREVVSS